MFKKVLSIALICMLIVALLVGCKKNDQEAATQKQQEQGSIAEEPKKPKEIPTLSIGYMFSNHQTPLMVAAAKQEAFKNKGVYLKEVVEREKYILMEGDEEIANFNIVVANNGGEVLTMMSQGHLNLGLSSITLPITSIDKGAEMKVLGPIHADGIALVMDKNSAINNLDDFVKYVESKDKPVIVGYHSPANAPVILFEAALKELGLTSTGDAMNMDADILLVDLKGTANLIPALVSNQVDAWVGPSPFPELAVIEEVGKVIFDLRDLPPIGQWHEFPCCVFSATDDAIKNYPYEIEKVFELLTIASEFSNNNREETGEIIAKWMGISEEAAKKTMTIFTTNPNERWLEHVALTFEALNNTNRLEGSLKDKALSEVKSQVFDLSFAQKVLGKKN